MRRLPAEDVVDERDDGEANNDRKYLVKYKGYAGYYWSSHINASLKEKWPDKKKSLAGSHPEAATCTLKELCASVIQGDPATATVLLADVARFAVTGLLKDVLVNLKQTIKLATRNNPRTRCPRKVSSITCMPQVCRSVRYLLLPGRRLPLSERVPGRPCLRRNVQAPGACDQAWRYSNQSSICSLR